MNIPDEKKIEIDLNDKNLPEAIRSLQPTLYKEEDSFYCVLGPNFKDGIFGMGSTAQQAMLDWEAHLRKRIIYPKKDDEIAQYAIDKLNAWKNEVG